MYVYIVVLYKVCRKSINYLYSADRYKCQRNIFYLMGICARVKAIRRSTMDITVRRAEIKDIDKVSILLSEVLELHAKLRPDIFISGTTKYTREELTNIFQNDETPVFVAIDNDEVVGYAFCVIKKQPFSTNMVDFKTLHIDDLCVDENCRGKHIGTILYKYVLEYAKSIGCYDVTLNVWEGNDNARAFYEKVGMFVKETQMEVILK